MSYLVLARKWRPRDFESLVGQDHVVRALTHALSTGRLHHAWLFTGTRGVGKTTLSRILAKSLNCETGITATPCGHCRACQEIDGGRFVDYVELDAASNRGVDEMTQLLEQAVYAPSSGRFKVYMIDEVHMLSGHAFNAMLKTLEEPPPHVKFILATTDPQKIPPTVLSRCLQFNLKQMPPQAVSQYLEMVLGQEEVPFEAPALRLIGKAASGSMRDALSLTDQAIAYSSGNLTTEAVRTMLGSVDQTHLTRLLHALARADAPGMLAVADALVTRGISLRAALAELAILLSQLAIEQRVPCDPSDADALDDDQRELAAILAPDLLQLFYTVAVHGRQELALAPDEYAGFVMVCLKMLSFVVSDATEDAQKKTPTNESGSALSAVSDVAPSTTPNTTPNTTQTNEASGRAQASAEQNTVSEPVGQARAAHQSTDHETIVPETTVDQSEPQFEQQFEQRQEMEPEPRSPEPEPLALSPVAIQDAVAQLSLDESLPAQWPELASNLPVTGMAQQLAAQSACLSVKGSVITLKVPTQALSQGAHVGRLVEVLTQQFGQRVQLDLHVGELASGTSAQSIADAKAAQRQRQAERIVHEDSFVNALIDGFGAQVLPGSVRAVGLSDGNAQS